MLLCLSVSESLLIDDVKAVTALRNSFEPDRGLTAKR
jgi:hypothetical protein